jgi:hypothetical protein
MNTYEPFDEDDDDDDGCEFKKMQKAFFDYQHAKETFDKDDDDAEDDEFKKMQKAFIDYQHAKETVTENTDMIVDEPYAFNWEEGDDSNETTAAPDQSLDSIMEYDPSGDSTALGASGARLAENSKKRKINHDVLLTLVVSSCIKNQ